MADQQSSFEQKIDAAGEIHFEEAGPLAEAKTEKKAAAERRADADDFSFRQVGSISTYIEPVSAAQTMDAVLSLFEENPDIQAVPVEENGAVIGYIEKSAVEERLEGAFLKLQVKDAEECIKRVSLAIYAKEYCERCLYKAFAATKESGAVYYPVFYTRKSFYGIVSLDALVARITEVHEQDMERAREIQQGIMPDEERLECLPFAMRAWNRMANPIGGDLYTVHKISQTKYIAGCFDVSGKNVAAALVTVAVNSFFAGIKFFTDIGSFPRQIVAALDRFIEDTVPLGTFVTAGIFFVDLEAKKLSIFNCGHTAIYFFVPESSSEGKRTIMVSELKASLPPLGMGAAAVSLEDGDVKIPSCAIEKGLKAYIYTDGLEDMQTEDGERYGNDRIKGLLKSLYPTSRREFARKLDAAVDEWIEEAMLPDDITVVDISF